MNIFEEKIEAWLSRTVPTRALNQCFDLPVVLATDIGLQRSENQDRVAALRIGAKASGNHPLVAVAVADGMGGMRDGAKCATLALSSFFYALTLYRGDEIERRATAAISYANDTVFRFAGGKGGATLAAVLLDQQLRPFIAHLGDSRVYSFGGGAKVERLTVDDSLAEAVGGHGRELLQFVGMGKGMRPHVQSIPLSIRNLAITTDGIHLVDSATLESILSHASELKSASERLSALARWCGGNDNASSAIVDLQSLMQEVHKGRDDGIQMWDPFGDLTAIWIRGDVANVANRQALAVAQEATSSALGEIFTSRYTTGTFKTKAPS
jgi:PPM family protein phosphatase